MLIYTILTCKLKSLKTFNLIKILKEQFSSDEGMEGIKKKNTQLLFYVTHIANVFHFVK